jgi:hypothetical protein
MKKRKKTHLKYYCKKCDYSSRNKTDFNRHLSTTKHKMETDGNILETIKTQLICLCGKTYKTRSGLFKHKKKCPSIVEKLDVSKNAKTKLIKSTNIDEQFMNVNDQLKILEKKKELAELNLKIAEINQRQIVNQTINNTNNTNNNMTINLFINEHCKNAMNLTDFVDNVKVSLEDLLYTKNNGYVKGISNIFVKQLQDMEPTQRPIHCSDKKRLQFYVKDADKWEKDNSHEKIDKTIDEITFKQIKNVKKWESMHPNYLEDEKLLIEWQTMIRNMTTGTNKNMTMEKEKACIKKELGLSVQVKPVIEQEKRMVGAACKKIMDKII